MPRPTSQNPEDDPREPEVDSLLRYLLGKSAENPFDPSRCHAQFVRAASPIVTHVWRDHLFYWHFPWLPSAAALEWLQNETVLIDCLKYRVMVNELAAEVVKTDIWVDPLEFRPYVAALVQWKCANLSRESLRLDEPEEPIEIPERFRKLIAAESRTPNAGTIGELMATYMVREGITRDEAFLRIWRFVYRRARDAGLDYAAACDVAQEVVLRLLKMERRRPDEHLRYPFALALRIMHQRIRDQLQKRKREVEMDDIESLAESENSLYPDSDQSDEEAELLQKVYRHMRKFPDRDHQYLIADIVDRLTSRRAAQKMFYLGHELLSAGATWHQITAARTRLIEAIGRSQ